MEVRFGGLLRFKVPASCAKLRWADYLARNKTPKFLRKDYVRGNPAEWTATDEPVSLKHVRAVEVYYRAWQPIDDVDDTRFEAYIKQRKSEFDYAQTTLDAKIDEHMPELERLRAAGRKPTVYLELNEAEGILLQDRRLRAKTRDASNPAAIRDTLGEDFWELTRHD
jgi:hypothetical protein